MVSVPDFASSSYNDKLNNKTMIYTSPTFDVILKLDVNLNLTVGPAGSHSVPLCQQEVNYTTTARQLYPQYPSVYM